MPDDGEVVSWARGPSPVVDENFDGLDDAWCVGMGGNRVGAEWWAVFVRVAGGTFPATKKMAALQDAMCAGTAGKQGWF